MPPRGAPARSGERRRRRREGPSEWNLWGPMAPTTFHSPRRVEPFGPSGGHHPPFTETSGGRTTGASCQLRRHPRELAAGDVEHLAVHVVRPRRAEEEHAAGRLLR